jgi:hypothetical protein
MDNHYSPLLPAEYIERRVVAKIAFFKDRMTQFGRLGLAVELLALAITGGGALLSTQKGYSRVATITTLVASGMMVWLQFHGAGNKVKRYNGVADALNECILNWKKLGRMEKQNRDEVNRLVKRCEDILRDEMNAWRSGLSQQSTVFEKAAADRSAKLKANMTNDSDNQV